MLLEFCLKKELCVSNTWFKREEKRKVIFRIGEHETEIDFVLIRKIILMVYTKCEGNPWGVSTCISPDASVVHAYGTGQLLGNSPVAGLRLSLRKSTRMMVTTMESNDLVLSEGRLLGPSCQRCYWQTGR